MEKQEVIEAHCKKCCYEWTTRSKMIFVSCPSCQNKVRIRKKMDGVDDD